MAIGDSNDILKRIKSLIPAGWFTDVPVFANAVLGGLSDALAAAYSMLAVVKASTRRLTTTGWLLDVDAFGFFGSSYLRRPNESDASFSKRYRDEIFRIRVTRAGIDKALFDLTGRHPVILEMWNGGDAGGGYGGPTIGYGVAGHYGSLQFPLQIFITAFRPASGGIPSVAGYGSSVGGYGVGSLEYGDLSFVQSAVSDAEIYETVARTVGAGIIPWTAISN